MKIKTPYSRSKKEVKNLEVVKYKEYDKYGKKIINRYVEFIVQGKNNQWKNTIPTKEFIKLNPKISVKGL